MVDVFRRVAHICQQIEQGGAWRLASQTRRGFLALKVALSLIVTAQASVAREPSPVGLQSPLITSGVHRVEAVRLTGAASRAHRIRCVRL